MMDSINQGRELTVDLGVDKTYRIIIGSGILEQSGELMGTAYRGRKLMLVSNPLVFSLYGERTVTALQKAGMDVHTFLMPDGEEYKNLQEAEKILDTAVDIGMERGSLMVALGGGVVGDITGFAAAIYQRGIPYIQIPTTLLAQVDSSVGGKTAVNHPRGKNMLGVFHQPKMVIIDINTLDTLAEREYLAGLGEVLKYGIIYNADFFRFLEHKALLVKSKDRLTLQDMIYHCLQIKSRIVAEDEKESGLRMILNLGHTFGHSLEKLGQYRDVKHGEAVAMGTVAASFLAEELGLLTASEVKQVAALFKDMGISTRFPSFKPEDVYQGMLNDKKVKNEKLRIIVPRGIGGYELVENPERDLMMDIISRCSKDT